MDLEKFDKWSAQFETMLDQLQFHEKAMQSAAHTHPIADTEYLSDCASQVAAEKHLRKIANDIRGLGFCYNNLRESVELKQEHFDSLD